MTSRELSARLSAKLFSEHVLTEDEIRKMFAPRPLRRESADQHVGSVGIVRAVKKNSLACDNEGEAKDFIVDADEGVIGSRG